MRKFGVVSSGRIPLDRGAVVFKVGSVVEWTPEEEAFFLQRAPENFVFLSDSFAPLWSVAIAGRFLPGQDLFGLLGDRSALLAWQSEQLAPNDAKPKKGKK